jgi:YD repeat-containing protein
VNASGQCGQTRSFIYDNRGFLTSETHPENGSTTYVSHDARGHLRRRYTGAPFQFDVELDYDRAERLVQAGQRLTASDTRPLKLFVYAEANDGTNRKNGRLFEAVRYNWLEIPAATPIPYNVQVVETYAYGDPDGNVSSRETKDYPCPVSAGQDCESLRPVAVNHSFRQEFTYDELDATKTLAYPKCLLGGCTTLADRSVTNTHVSGMLTSVAAANTASAAITYHESGLVKAVVRGNAVTDTQLIDPLMPGRPLEIVTTGATTVGACIAPSFTQQPASVTIEQGASATLTALATGENGQAITYQWYRGTAADVTHPLGTGTSVSVSPASTTNYWVRATNSCGATPSTTAQVTVCDPAEITAGQANLTMTSGEARTLQISAAGSPSLSFAWFTVAGGIETVIPSATEASLTIGPHQTTTYRVRVTNDCGEASDDATVTVVDPPAVPGFVSALYNAGTGRVDLSWPSSTSDVGISHYVIRRLPANVVFQISHPVLSYSDQTALVANKAYVYRVTAVDNNGVSSGESAPDLASVRAFTTDPLPGPGLAIVEAVHISELRSAVDGVRFAVGLPPAWSSYAPPVGLPVNAADFTQLRDRLNEARAALSMSLITFSAPVTPGQPISGTTLTELRDGVK